MDLVADKLRDFLPKQTATEWRVEVHCPRFMQLFSKVPFPRIQRIGFNGDRLLTRYVLYPRLLSRLNKDFNFCFCWYVELMRMN